MQDCALWSREKAQRAEPPTKIRLETEPGLICSAKLSFPRLLVANSPFFLVSWDVMIHRPVSTVTLNLPEKLLYYCVILDGMLVHGCFDAEKHGRQLFTKKHLGCGCFIGLG